jgi:hypothetical protein
LDGVTTQTDEEENTVRKRTLQLFQSLLAIFALYGLLRPGDNQQLWVSLACLMGILVVGKAQDRFAEPTNQEQPQRNEGDKDDTQAARQALEWLLKSKNVQLITDAIQHLLKDLGLVVSPSPDHTGIDRIVRMPGTEVIFGLKILGDVTKLDENWKGWEELASFDQGQGGKQRLLIIGSSLKEISGDGKQRHKNFPLKSQRLLSSKHVVAMTTLTLGKIYMSCIKKKLDLKTVFHPIENHPGGVFRLEGLAQ